MTRRLPIPPGTLTNDQHRLLDLGWYGLNDLLGPNHPTTHDYRTATLTLTDHLTNPDRASRPAERSTGGDIPDPTSSTASSRAKHLAALEAILERTTELLQVATIVARLCAQVRVVASGPQHDQAIRNHRCTPKPERSLEAWVDLTCRELWVRQTDGGQLCSRCLGRYYRHERDPDTYKAGRNRAA